MGVGRGREEWGGVEGGWLEGGVGGWGLKGAGWGCGGSRGKGGYLGNGGYRSRRLLVRLVVVYGSEEGCGDGSCWSRLTELGGPRGCDGGKRGGSGWWQRL